MSSVYPFEPARTPPAPPAPTGGMANLIDAPTPVLIDSPSAGTVLNGVPVKKKKATRLNLDALGVLVFTVAVVFTLMIASFIASFASIYEVAVYTGLPAEWLWVFPVFIDLAILAYTLSLFIFKHRKESTWRTLLGLFGFALLSIAANVSHTLAFWDGNITSYQAWIGVILTAAAPIAVLLASEEIGRLAFSPEK